MSDLWNEIGVSIVIPTYKRPDDILRALKSVEDEARKQKLCEIVVTDNDPAASARDIVTAFIDQTDVTTFYVHEPNPGVSNARNTALKNARGRYIAFLDDDMEALEGWVTQSLKASDDFDAGLVFGPVDAVMPEGKAIYPYMAPAFDRIPYTETGLIDEGVATGGCLVDRKKCDMPSPVFDPAMNQTGGEDDAFFRHVMERGTKAVWTNDAKCLEHVPEKRATIRYIWLRNFAFGQSPSQEASEVGLKGTPRVLFWMAVGGAQALLTLPQLIATNLIQSPKRVKALAKFAQGIGKIFWFKVFSPKLYGN
jgi:glycosyltransferase involved in cell wall biosynthesis